MNEEKSRLGLRVFKRTAKHLILLWKRQPGADPSSVEISYREMAPKGAAGKGKTVVVPPTFFSIDEPTAAKEAGSGGSISAETVICVILEARAGLDPDGLYYITVKCGSEYEGLRLTPAGTYPSHEREDRAKNTHLFGWDDEGQCWRKLNAVKGPDNRWYLGTIAVEPSQGD